MARYNSVNPTGSIAGGSTLSTPASGLLTTITGSGTVTLPSPVLYAGSTQTFYNSTGSAITLSSSPTFIVIPGITGSSTTISLAGGAIITLVSDGANYVAQAWLGGAVVTTSLTATGGTINGVSIGATTTSTGAFTTLTATNTTSLAGGSASGVFSFTSNQTSNATNNGAIVVTGGAGIGGSLYVGGTSYVVNATNPTTWVSVDTALTTQSMYMQVNTTNSDTRIGSYTNHALGIYTNNTVRMTVDTSGKVGIGTGANPAAKLHIINSSVSGIGSVPSGSSVIVDSNSNNYLTFRSTADNATQSGLVMQDNNVGGYLVFRNYDSGNAAISDRMFIAGSQGVNIQYGGADSVDVTAKTTVARFDSNGLTVVANRFAQGAEYETASRSGETSISSGGYKELFRMSPVRLGTSGMFAISATRGSYVTTSQYSWTASHNYQGTITQLSSSSYTQVSVNLDVESSGGVIISIDWGQGYTASFPMDYTVTVIKMCGGSAIDFSSAGADRSSVPGGYQRRYNFNSQANGFRAENGYFSSLGKGSGSFKIDHPLPELTDTRHLVHSFIEGPKADLIYRGEVDLIAGRAEINIDTESDMTEGTFEALCRTVQCFTSNETDWSAVRGRVTGNILKIECQDTASTATISWMVVGERKDKHMYETEWTDDDGRVIVEPLKNPVQTDFPPYPEHVNTSEDTNGTI